MQVAANLDGYDVIGDIHGHADALRRLLIKLDYREVDGVFQHDARKVIFIDDFVDRGPEQKEVLRIAKNMCDADTAVAILGNHEFNAIGWATPDGKSGFLRPHTPEKRDQHQEFLEQLDGGSQEYLDAIRWFRSLPVWLEFPDLRLVHACWHDASRADLSPYLDSQRCFTDEGLREAYRRGSKAYDAAEILMKGPEERLPDGLSFADENGIPRYDVRVRWWDASATTFRRAAQGWKGNLEELPDDPLPRDFRYFESVPVLFGHYWETGEPTITAPNAACLDFGVASKDSGYLTAYRWSGERELSSHNLVYVPSA
jgi:Calcineurin-like phosphoesterase